LAKRIIGVRPRAQVIGIDADAGMLAMARQRLPAGAFTPMVGDFERMEIPACNLVSASFALHHVRSLKAKAVLYRKLHAALKRGGTLVSADSFLASDRRLQAVHRAAWLSHLQRRYSPRRAQQFLADWAEEDYYVPLEREMALLRAAGFSVEVVWRRDGFATVAARR
jgi:ubiquinone/menaquinone biosynthesis C-methylase UbiE